MTCAQSTHPSMSESNAFFWALSSIINAAFECTPRELYIKFMSDDGDLSVNELLDLTACYGIAKLRTYSTDPILNYIEISLKDSPTWRQVLGELDVIYRRGTVEGYQLESLQFIKQNREETVIEAIFGT